MGVLMILTVKLDLLYNMGISIWGLLFGNVYAVVAFFIVVLIEAKIMRRHFRRFDQKKSITYSLIVNALSTILGLLLIFLMGGLSDYAPKTLLEYIFIISGIR